MIALSPRSIGIAPASKRMLQHYQSSTRETPEGEIMNSNERQRVEKRGRPGDRSTPWWTAQQAGNLAGGYVSRDDCPDTRYGTHGDQCGGLRTPIRIARTSRIRGSAADCSIGHVYFRATHTQGRNEQHECFLSFLSLECGAKRRTWRHVAPASLAAMLGWWSSGCLSGWRSAHSAGESQRLSTKHPGGNRILPEHR